MGYKVTSEFNAVDAVRHGVPHTGIDLSMPTGTKLRSIMDGYVTKVFDGSGTLGNGVKIKGLDGKEYIFGHMDSVSVKIGQVVKFGTEIGKSGSSGRSTGPHLHFAIQENGVYIDPTRYKGMLDKVTGDYIAGPANTRDEMMGQEPLSCQPDGDIAWWDFAGKAQAAFDMRVCEIKLDFLAYLKATVEMIGELSYTVALIGGGILLVLYSLGGVTRAKKYFTVLQLCHIFIRVTLGGK